MFHRQEIAVNKATGVPVPGVIVRLFDANDNPVSLYADANGTPIVSVSGIANAAVADDAGNYSYYVANGVYTERLYVGDSLAYSIANLVCQGLVTTIQTPTFADAANITTSSDTNLVIVSGTDDVGDAGTGRTFAYDETVDDDYVASNPDTSFVDGTGRGFREIPGSSAVSLSDHLASTDPGKGAALVGTVTGETLDNALPAFAVRDGGSISAAIALAAGGGIVRLAKNGSYSISSAVTLTAGIILDLNGATVTASTAMTNMVTVTGDKSGIIGPGTIDGNSVVTGYLVSATDGDDMTFCGFEMVNWTAGLYIAAASRDIYRPVVHNIYAHTPISNPVSYPINLTGGSAYRTVYNCSVNYNTVTGIHGNFGVNGTADQIALQNCEGGEVAFNRSNAGGENGIAVSRLSKNVYIHDNDCRENDGYGIQLGSSHVQLQLDTVSGLSVAQVITGSSSGATGTIAAIRSTYVFCTSISGEFTTSDTVNAGANTVTNVRYGEGSRLENNTAVDNNYNSASAGGFLITWQRGKPTRVLGNRGYNTLGAAGTQINGLSAASCSNVDYGVNYFDGNAAANEQWSSSPHYTIASEAEYQVPATVPTLEEGDSVQITFTIPGIVSGQFINATLAGTDGFLIGAKATATDTVLVTIVNATSTTIAGVDRTFIFKGRQKGFGLSNTSGGSASVGTVKKNAARRSQLSADSAAVNNSTTLTDSGLAMSVQASKTYAFRVFLHVSSGTTPGYKIGFVYPAGTTGAYSSNRASAGVAETSISTTTVGTGSATNRIMVIDGVFTTTTSGTFALRFAQNTADLSDTKILAGSFMEVVG